jgi:RNA polymerase sigma-70 factor (ECF subfamily)
MRKSDREHLRAQDLADEDLLRLAQRGELAAFELVYERHKRAAYSLAYRIVGSHPVAEDVVQEVFLSVWRSKERYDATRASVRTWLLRIVRWRAIDALRAGAYERREVRGDDLAETVESGEAGPDEKVVRGDEAAAVRAAVGWLPAQQRQVVELAYFRGFSQSEIAEIVDAPLGTVKGRMRLALDKLRGSLDDTAAARKVEEVTE